MTWISPNFEDSYLKDVSWDDDFERFIDVYENRVKGWFLEQSKLLGGERHAGFAQLQILLSYFEGHAIVYYGQDSKRRSREFFPKRPRVGVSFVEE